MNQKSWSDIIHEIAPSGTLQRQSPAEESINLAWRITSPISQDFSDSMKTVWEIALPAYLHVEMQFLRAYPGVVGKEPYFASFEPLFQHAPTSINWQEAEKLMATILQSHFIFDPSTFSEQVRMIYGKDTVCVVTAYDNTSNTPIGFITFLIRPAYPSGTIKVMSLAVDPTQQGKGIGKILMSSIFKIVPHITRIFLCTRVTNDRALKAYYSWGFTPDEDPIMDHPFNRDHWTFLEYQCTGVGALESTAQQLSIATR